MSLPLQCISLMIWSNLLSIKSSLFISFSPTVAHCAHLYLYCSMSTTLYFGSKILTAQEYFLITAAIFDNCCYQMLKFPCRDEYSTKPQLCGLNSKLWDEFKKRKKKRAKTAGRCYHKQKVTATAQIKK